MSNFKEKIKDIIYNSMDYILMIIIVVVIGVIIAWRLDILFGDNDLDAEENTIENQEVIVDSSKRDEDDSRPDENGNDQDEDEDEGEEQEETDQEEEENHEEEEEERVTSHNRGPASQATVKIVIPPGTGSSTIGKMLKDQGLIREVSQFEERAREMGLEKVLQAGTFEIPRMASLDEIIKIIAKRM